MVTKLRDALSDSTMMLVNEHRRLSNELAELEKKMTTDGISDDLVRKLRAQVNAEETRLADASAALAAAEAHTHVSARDAEAARAQARAEAASQCKSRIADLLDRKLALIERSEQLCR